MMLRFYEHPGCTTCKKARAWLEENNIPITRIDIREKTPERELLKELLESGSVSRRRLFNTSGNRYKELELKDRLDALSPAEAVELLVSDGMLIRRPFITDGKSATMGYDEDGFERTWK